MKNYSFRTIGNITLIAIVLIAAQTANAASFYDRLFGSNEIINEFIAQAQIGGTLNLPAIDDAPQATETWTGGDNNNSNWTTNSNWTGIGGAGPGDGRVAVARFGRLCQNLPQKIGTFTERDSQRLMRVNGEAR